MLQPAGGELDFTFRRQAGQPVDLAGGRAEMLSKAGSVGGKTAEYKATVGVRSRHPPQSQVQLALAVALEKREANELAGVAIRPPVVGAAESRRVTFGIGADLIAAVRATVEQQVQLPVPVSGHDDVL